ncbi:MAG: hypothetical protein NZ551_10100, partial [Microscillaceae bacterium]|nr:hypothetical protein [Microscillaceae bacterium]MDW8461548.1 hypothetical protein [Cytophagales bacterium]
MYLQTEHQKIRIMHVCTAFQRVILWVSLCFFIFCATTSAFAQTISGKIETKTGEKIAYAQITLKDSVNTFQIKEFGFAHQG